MSDVAMTLILATQSDLFLCKKYRCNIQEENP